MLFQTLFQILIFVFFWSGKSVAQLYKFFVFMRQPFLNKKVINSNLNMLRKVQKRLFIGSNMVESLIL